MKAKMSFTSFAALMLAVFTMQAQEKNIVMNGSFEATCGNIHSPGVYYLADSVSSSNNTTVDLFSKDACGKNFGVPANYMGSQESKTGNNYAGIIAYSADDWGFFRTQPGYRKYSEYIQMSFSEPLVAGKAYTVSFNAALSEKSAYAVAGLGLYISKEKVNVNNNAYLDIVPHFITTEILTSTDWTNFSGSFVAAGGERYLPLGCFDQYMDTLKVVAANTNNSRKSYYYIDDVGLSPEIDAKEDITKVLAGSCYQLNNLNFEMDKAVIMESSYDELKSLTRFLKTYPYITVYIDGHTDKTGSDQHNDKLSEQRASAVKAYLVKNGIKESRMNARGYGESLPIDVKKDNSLTNRRVEITICASPVIKAEAKR